MRRCNQCWHLRFDWEFVSEQPHAQCATCRMRDPKESRGRRGLESDRATRVRFVLRSGNRKTGPIPVSMTTANTCPPSCGLYGRGCYGESGYLKGHWKHVGRDGMSWARFCQMVSELPPGQVWRHNEVGDLPGIGEEIDRTKLALLVIANHGKRGFTYTHKTADLDAIADANARGFTVNLSADSLIEADRFAEQGAGPVVVLLPKHAPNRLKTPAGRKVIVCPAQRMAIDCATCKLCAVSTRKSIVGFRAHGHAERAVAQGLVQLRLGAHA